VLLRRERWTAIYASTLVAGHTGVLLLVCPVALENPIVFTRYMLPTLPWVLLCVAQGLAALADVVSERFSRPAFATLAVTVLPLALVFGGPLGDPALRHSSFLHGPSFLSFACPRAELPAEAVPEIYRVIARTPGRGAVVEAPGITLAMPWALRLVLLDNLRIYQETHRRRVEAAAEGFVRDARLALRNTVDARPQDLLDGDADWVLVHRNLDAEGRAAAPRFCRGAVETPAEEGPSSPVEEARRLEDRFTRAWGPPDYADDTIVAWKLDPARRAGERRPLDYFRSGGTASSSRQASPAQPASLRTRSDSLAWRSAGKEAARLSSSPGSRARS